MYGKGSKGGGRTPSATWLRSQIAMHLGSEQYNALCIQADQARSRINRSAWFLEQESVKSIPGLAEDYQRYRNEEIARSIDKRRQELAYWLEQWEVEHSPARRQNIERAIARCKRYIEQHIKQYPTYWKNVLEVCQKLIDSGVYGGTGIKLATAGIDDPVCIVCKRHDGAYDLLVAGFSATNDLDELGVNNYLEERGIPLTGWE